MHCSINKDLLLIKFLYFFELSAHACLFMYITPFMYEFGITATELAILNFTGHFTTLFIRPFFGFMADKYQKYREIIAISTFLCATLNGLKLAVPKYSPPVNASIPINFFLTENFTNPIRLTMCFANATTVSCWPSPVIDYLHTSMPIIVNPQNLIPSNISCSSFKVFGLNAPVKLDTLSPLCTNVLQNCTESQIATLLKIYNEYGFTGSLTFWLFFLIKLGSHGLFSAVHGLTDAVTFVKLDKEKSHEFGFTRIFGTIGVLVLSIITGLILFAFDWANKNRNWATIKNMMKLSQYTPCFILGLFVLLMVVILATLLKNDERVHTVPFWKSIHGLFRNVEITVFFIFSIFGGFIVSVLIEYYFLIMSHMFHDLPKYFPGVVHAIMTISEMIFIGASPVFLKYMSDEFWISLAFGFWGLKWLSYTFVRNYWLLLLVEVLHGPAFGLMLPCMMSYISKFAEKSTQGRVQSVFSSFFLNIGGALGALYGGTMLDHYGFNGIFISMSVFSFICALLYYPLQVLVIQKHCRKKNQYFTNEKEMEVLEYEEREVYL